MSFLMNLPYLDLNYIPQPSDFEFLRTNPAPNAYSLSLFPRWSSPLLFLAQRPPLPFLGLLISPRPLLVHPPLSPTRGPQQNPSPSPRLGLDVFSLPYVRNGASSGPSCLVDESTSHESISHSVQPVHSMRTPSQSGIFEPNSKYAGLVLVTSSVPLVRFLLFLNLICVS